MQCLKCYMQFIYLFSYIIELERLPNASISPLMKVRPTDRIKQSVGFLVNATHEDIGRQSKMRDNFAMLLSNHAHGVRSPVVLKLR